MSSVLRVLSPAAIDPHFSGMSIAFILGNAEFLKAIETVHFELNGTPPAADVELMAYLIQGKLEGTLPGEKNPNSALPLSEIPNQDDVLFPFLAQYPAHVRVQAKA